MANETIVRNMDFSAFDTDPQYKFVREDRNHTRYYSTSKCPKCGGKGYIPGYEYIQGGVCFKCGGSGNTDPRQVIVRTEEYAEKLRKNRLEKARKTAAARNEKYLSSLGFNVFGEAWVVMGDTYKIKEQLKAMGAKFDDRIGWKFDHPVAEFPVVKISCIDTIVSNEELEKDCSYSKLFYETADGTLCLNSYDSVVGYIRDLRDAWNRENNSTEYYGSVGQKVELKVTLTRIGSFDTRFGTTRVYTFEDDNAHQFVWKTGSWFEDSKGKVFTLTGTVKAHNEYRGDRQTELTRCKVME